MGLRELTKPEGFAIVLPVAMSLFKLMLSGFGVAGVQFLMMTIGSSTFWTGAALWLREMGACGHFGNPSPNN